MPHLVLLVEDDHGLRRALQRAFEDAGYEVQGVPDGREALRLLQVARRRPDVVITDYNYGVPEMDGAFFTYTMGIWYPTIPVIVLSGENKLETLVPGAQRYFQKSFDSARDVIKATGELILERASIVK